MEWQISKEFSRGFFYNIIGRRVYLSGTRPDELIGNTGASQGCVLSPILFSVYTNEVVSTNALLTLMKFTDDMALVVHLQDENSLEEYFLLSSKLMVQGQFFWM